MATREPLACYIAGMKSELSPGLSRTATYLTTLEMRARQLARDVFSTPAMIGLMERTCVELTEPYLEEDEHSGDSRGCPASSSDEYRPERYDHCRASGKKGQQAALCGIGDQRSECQDRRWHAWPSGDQHSALCKRIGELTEHSTVLIILNLARIIHAQRKNYDTVSIEE